jgi:uncharacterized repeat protein (TIGR03843 family)
LHTEAAAVLDDEAVETILTHGSLELEGRLLSASNASFTGHVSLEGLQLRCVYKPVAGERPLWDFPDGTLAGREYATWLISESGGFDVVPTTVLRDGQFGAGMCQRWVDTDPDVGLVDVVSDDFDEPGWLAVLEAEDQRGRPVTLIHADDPRLRGMAVFDVVVNNADRKGGHVLVEADGGSAAPFGSAVWGCDHGVTLHPEDKLRTVLWGWADEPIRDVDRERLDALVAALDGDLAHSLAPHLTALEIDALLARALVLRSVGTMPAPGHGWRVIPWPPF